MDQEDHCRVLEELSELLPLANMSQYLMSIVQLLSVVNLNKISNLIKSTRVPRVTTHFIEIILPSPCYVD